jgi:multiple sugar transport system permease protein
MTSRRTPSAALVYLGLALGAAITLAPFAFGLLTSFTTAHQFATGEPLTLPRPPTLSNYTGLAAVSDDGATRVA